MFFCYSFLVILLISSYPTHFPFACIGCDIVCGMGRCDGAVDGAALAQTSGNNVYGPVLMSPGYPLLLAGSSFTSGTGLSVGGNLHLFWRR